MSLFTRLLLPSGRLLDRVLVVGAWCAAFAVVATTVVAVVWYFHPVVYRDMWYMLDLVRTSPTESSFWATVWLPWSDHRIIFPKLFYALDFRLGGTGAFLVGLNLLGHAAVALLLGIAIRRQAGLEAGDKRVFTAAAWIACFWLVQSGNLLWGFQIAWSLNAVAVAAAILLVSDMKGGEGTTSVAWRGFGVMLLLIVAMFSLANGVLMWGILGFLLWRSGAPRALQVMWWLCAALAMAAAFSATTDAAASHPFTGRHVLFYLALLGSPFSRIHLEAGIVLGAVGFAAFAVFAIRYLRTGERGPFFTFAFAQTTYVVLSAVLITVGRGYKGVDQATSSRYYPPLLVFWCLLFCLAWLASRKVRGGAWIRAALAVGAVSVIAVGQWASLPERAERSLKADLALLALAANVGDSTTLEYVNMFPDSAQFWQEAEFLKSRNLSFYHSAPWVRTQGMPVSEAFTLEDGPEISATFETTPLVTLPGRPGSFLQGRYDSAARTPTGIVAVRAGRVAGFANTRRRGCRGCFSGFVAAPAAPDEDGEISLYMVYGTKVPRAYRLTAAEAADQR